jgi:hypothetical protein
MSITAATRGNLITLQDAKATGNGLALAIPPGITKHLFYVSAATGVTAGAITFESASDPNYAGTWAALPSYTDPTPGKVNPLTVVADNEKLYSYEGPLAAVRARISTTISGGGAPSATVKYLGA